ncbi:hypothetical protein K5I29_03230 [Flavobacterium agricola]|uniref:DUF4377 domain-containing protein n=1 Tax=Flavobacterium agricola TaxID=2870839 RepID=A0ABY6M3X1_9FLAO|nr:hypothetical protein [Flavobacterium agricola]UYW01941.1 hypothetical protein K5I29_03230 [Flavobacterium agricola]
MKLFNSLLSLLLLVMSSCSDKGNIEIAVENKEPLSFNDVLNVVFYNTSVNDLKFKIKNDSIINTHSDENFIYYKIFDESYNEILKENIHFTGGDYIYYEYINYPDSLNIYLEKAKRAKIERLKRIKNHQINYTIKPNEKISLSLKLERLEEDFTEYDSDHYFYHIHFDESKIHYIAFYYRGEIITLNNTNKEQIIEVQTLISPYYPL